MSAVVVARSASPRAFDLCLRSALAEPWIDDLVVVDNASPPPIASALRALQADRRDVRVVRSQALLSGAAAANLGAQQARGRWLLFLAPDVALHRGAVARMAAAGGGVHAPWIVGGRLVDAEGRDRRAQRTRPLGAWSAWRMAMEWPGPAPFRPRLSSRARGAAEPIAVGAVSGALMLTPRADFEQLGGFDEHFATDGADYDLCWRVAEAGGRVLFEPAAAAVQFAPPRPGRREVQGLARLAAKSARTPVQRGFARLAGPAFTVLVAARNLVAGLPPVRR